MSPGAGTEQQQAAEGDGVGVAVAAETGNDRPSQPAGTGRNVERMDPVGGDLDPAIQHVVKENR
jgi:hypothetical protein